MIRLLLASTVLWLSGASALAETHTVSSGETLWRIAKKYGITVRQIQDANSLSGDLIHPGQELEIPTSSPQVVSTTTTTQPQQPHPAPTPAAPPPIPTDNESALRAKLLAETRAIARHKVRYSGQWKPPGSSEKLVMDCSNTARYLYKKTTGKEIGRTASDQYYLLRQKKRVWDAPRSASGQVDPAWLKNTLKAGDLLFWEHTYKPTRQPPITHVMIFIGADSRGRLVMAGSQTMGAIEPPIGAGGPNIYIFHADAPCGGYSTGWFGKKIKGRFVAIGRP